MQLVTLGICLIVSPAKDNILSLPIMEFVSNVLNRAAMNAHLLILVSVFPVYLDFLFPMEHAPSARPTVSYAMWMELAINVV